MGRRGGRASTVQPARHLLLTRPRPATACNKAGPQLPASVAGGGGVKPAGTTRGREPARGEEEGPPAPRPHPTLPSSAPSHPNPRPSAPQPPPLPPSPPARRDAGPPRDATPAPNKDGESVGRRGVGHVVTPARTRSHVVLREGRPPRPERD